MLVLTRKLGQTLRIGNITVMVVRVKGQEVRIGVEAPDDVVITRGELSDRHRHDAVQDE